MRHLWWAVCLGGLTACVVLPHPTPADAERGLTQWPGLSVALLEQGRSVYADRCSACHRLYPPESRSPEMWTRQVAKMAPRAHLRPDEQRLIEQFVSTLSTRPPDGR